MYSVVLATVLSVGGGGGDSTGWFLHGCHGCHGCCGCSGYAFGGCYGCCGCYGCYGCCGGWYGCYGCYGCCGCYGPAVVYYAPTAYFAPVVSYSYAVATPAVSTTVAVSGTSESRKEIEALRAQVEMLRRQLEGTKKKVPLEEVAAVASQPATAKVTVQLPADAKLFIDNVACPLTSEKRSFDTPALQPGRQYYYTVRAEAVRGGTTVSQTQRIVVEAGKDVAVSFSNITPTSVAAAPRP